MDFPTALEIKAEIIAEIAIAKQQGPAGKPWVESLHKRLDSMDKIIQRIKHNDPKRSPFRENWPCLTS